MQPMDRFNCLATSPSRRAPASWRVRARRRELCAARPCATRPCATGGTRAPVAASPRSQFVSSPRSPRRDEPCSGPRRCPIDRWSRTIGRTTRRCRCSKGPSTPPTSGSTSTTTGGHTIRAAPPDDLSRELRAKTKRCSSEGVAGVNTLSPSHGVGRENIWYSGHVADVPTSELGARAVARRWR